MTVARATPGRAGEQAGGRAGAALAALGLAALLCGGVGCRSTPSNADGAGDGGAAARDGGPRDGALGDVFNLFDETSVTLVSSRSLGEPGELPVALVRSGTSGEALALTDRAVYRLGSDDRVRSRRPLPAPSSGAALHLGDVRAQGGGLAALASWGADDKTDAGVYVAFGAADGTITPGEMLRVGDRGHRARLSVDGALSVASTRPDGTTFALELRDASRSGGLGAARRVATLPAGSALGAYVRDGDRAALCIVGSSGTAGGGTHVAAQLVLSLPGLLQPSIFDVTPRTRDARGHCLLASSPRGYLMVYGIKAGAPEVDVAPDVTSADLNAAQVLDKAGNMLGSTWVLSQIPALVEPLQIVFDGARYVVLYQITGYRGGRLAMSAFAPDGTVVFRDAVLPLDYEPGRLLGGALAPTDDPKVYRVIYGVLRPWDRGQLQIVRVRVR